jgi:hypothetical protein
MYRVIVRFKDLQDDNHIYNAGDAFPRTGYRPSKKRIAELASDKNKRKMPLIEEVKEDVDGDLSGDKKLV